jgi:thiamine biosynthesis lipoprotein
MGTIVTIQVVPSEPDVDAAIDRCFDWFREIEARCTRFDLTSELMQLTSHVGERLPVSPILFEALRFALQVAAETSGAFDPTVGYEMESRGFDREYRTGAAVRSGRAADSGASYRDIHLDARDRTVTISRPLILDLGAVVKGLAVDTAARELQPFRNFAIDAGGDLYLAGHNPQGMPWSVGIRHPRRDGELAHTVHVSNKAVCTSGDYERGEHILDPRTRTPVQTVASATVIADSAMLADALATAVFVLGPQQGLELLARMDVEGMIMTPQLERYETPGFCHAA